MPLFGNFAQNAARTCSLISKLSGNFVRALFPGSRPYALIAIAILITALQLYGSRVSNEYRYNWDMLAYIGSAFELEGYSKDLIHKETYRLVRDHVPENTFASLTDGKYRSANYESADVFAAQLPFFNVKRLFPMMVWAFWKAGINPVDATGYIPAAAYLLFGMVAFFWLRTAMPMLLAGSIALAIATSPILLPVAYFRTPDALAAAMILLTLFLVAQGRVYWAMFAALLAINARPDAILAVAAIACFFAVRRQWYPMAGFLIGGGIVFKIVTVGGYPWSTLIYHTFVEHQLYPSEFTSPLTFADYRALYATELIRTWDLNLPFFILIGVGVAGAVMRAQRTGWLDTYTLLFGACLGCIAAHWVIFPAGLSRHLAPYYAAIMVLLFISLARAFELTRPRHPEGDTP